MMHVFRLAALGLVMSASMAMLTGCATTQIYSQWRDSSFSGHLLKSGRILVLCQARDDTLRRVCEDQWAAQMSAQGISVVRSYSLPGFPPGGTANPDEIKTAAQTNGADAVVSVQLTVSDFAVVNPGPQVGVGVGGGGGGGYRGGGFSFGGLGISFPVGGATTTQGMSSSTALVDIASGVPVWSGNASTPADTDLSAQVSALTKVTVEAIKKAGII